MTVETQRPHPGLVLSGKYRIDGLLGTGGMGEVYEATQLNLGRKVALKVLHPQYAAQDDALVRFEREARVAAALEHPNAVEIYDFGKSLGYVYLAMERLHGAPLRSFVDEHLPLLPHERAAEVVSEVAGVLVKAHAMGLVHRDLKPDNVFVEPPPAPGARERIVVVDFGLAFIEGSTDAGRLTHDGQVTGTPDYLSPEQGLGIAIGPPTDIYALGCMLYEMLVGRAPFQGNFVQVVTQQVYALPTAPSVARPDVRMPRALEALTLAMLAKKPEDRPTALEVRQELARTGGLAHERGRERIGLEGRAARMISMRPLGPPRPIGPGAATEGPAPAPAVSAGEGTLVAVVGTLGPDHAIGLASHGLTAYVVDADDASGDAFEGAAAVWAPGAPPAAIEALVARTGRPVLTDVVAGDTVGLAACLRAGAAEVLARPVRVEELARKLGRAVKKHRSRG